MLHNVTKGLGRQATHALCGVLCQDFQRTHDVRSQSADSISPELDILSLARAQTHAYAGDGAP